jgi:hypothetical protein
LFSIGRSIDEATMGIQGDAHITGAKDNVYCIHQFASGIARRSRIGKTRNGNRELMQRGDFLESEISRDALKI